MIPEYLYKDNREVVTELMRFGITPASMAEYTHPQLAWILEVMDYLYTQTRSYGLECAQSFAKHYGLEVEESA